MLKNVYPSRVKRNPFFFENVPGDVDLPGLSLRWGFLSFCVNLIKLLQRNYRTKISGENETAGAPLAPKQVPEEEGGIIGHYSLQGWNASEILMC